MSTLFVIEDNDVDRWIMRMNVEKLELFQEVMYYADGEPLMQYLIQHKDDENRLPDGILLDLRMPGFDGWKVLDALKCLYSQLAKKINVYVISATMFRDAQLSARQYEFVKDFFLKPITKQNLLSIHSELSLAGNYSNG